MMRRLNIALVASVLVGLAGCGQSTETGKQSSGAKPDQSIFDAANNGYLDKSFDSGNKESWQKAIKVRAQGQNDYERSKPL